MRRYHGLIDDRMSLHEQGRKRGRVGSSYDATITTLPTRPRWRRSASTRTRVLAGLKAPVSSAMVAICETRLNWRPDSVYRLEDTKVHRQWDWGRRIWSPPQAMEALRSALALDPHLTVLITHGLFDLVTPYLRTQLLLDQVPEAGIGERIHFSVYPGGHMFYTNDASRAALRDEAARLFGWR